MANKRGCCSAQLGCCFGGLACRLCCRCFPSALESTTTRLMYTLILFLGTVLMCLSLDPELRKTVLPYHRTCQMLKIGTTCEVVFGYRAAYRIAFALSGFFFFMSVWTIGLKSSRGIRGHFQNGAWIWKFLILIGIGVGVFSIPQERMEYFHIVWMYIALVGGVAFILIQLWLLVFFARSLGNKISRRIADGGSVICWYGVSTICTILCFAVSLIGLMLLFKYFTSWENCNTNKIFIGVNAALCLLLSVLSAIICCRPSETHSALLQASIISVYITYLTWTALSSAPREPTPRHEPVAHYPIDPRSEDLMPRGVNGAISGQEFYCGPDDLHFKYNEVVLPYVGVIIMFFTVVYSSIGTSADSADALGFTIRRDKKSAKEPESSCCSCLRPVRRSSGRGESEMIVGGQRIWRNEREGNTYNYSLFHVVFCLASMYIMMTMTGWLMPDDERNKPEPSGKDVTLTDFNRNWATVWIKMGSSWACVLLYVVALPVRRFGRYRIGDQGQTDGPSPVPTRDLEIYERETVT